MNWHPHHGFKRRDRVNYRPQNFKEDDREDNAGGVSIRFEKNRLLRAQNGGKTFRPVNRTFIWAYFGHESSKRKPTNFSCGMNFAIPKECYTLATIRKHIEKTRSDES